MRIAAKALCAAGLTALCWATAATAGTIQVVSAGDEFAAAHPRRAAKAMPAAFHSTMDNVFGPGRWRQTSGYRTQAQEDALRQQGAGTVAPGHVSRHSVGGPDAPGAYDAVVDNMSLEAAAAKLRQAGKGFARVIAEGAHGNQGAHLHVELTSNTSRKDASDPVAED
jgi:hypothetical protein